MNGAWRRILAVLVKEARQLLRDRATLGMLIGIPILQIILFGCAIELSPHSLAVTIVSSDRQNAEHLRRLIESQGSPARVTSQTSLVLARVALARGQTLVVVDADASPRKIYIDATDPVLAAHAEAMIDRLVKSVAGSIGDEQNEPSPITIDRLWNPAGRTQPYLVSGLLGVILTMSLVMMSALSIARERERGTLEGLLTMPVRRAEIWVGKLAPYLVLAVVQAAFVLLVAYAGFDIRPVGSITLIFFATLLFAAANLALGFLFSCVARQQMQAMQMTFFFFLPSSLLSGFMFPFSAMPAWARALAEILPLTHYLRIVRGLVLRGVDTGFVLAELMPIAVFGICAATASLLGWRRQIN
jgi:ABC-2 type transport system permease protein